MLKHTTISIGKRAFIRLRSGSTAEGRVAELTNRAVTLEDGRRIQKCDIKSMSIRKPTGRK